LLQGAAALMAPAPVHVAAIASNGSREVILGGSYGFLRTPSAGGPDPDRASGGIESFCATSASSFSHLP